MKKRANLYFAALLGAMSPLSTVTALAAQSNSVIANATQQQNSCTGTVKDSYGEPVIGATIRIDGKTGGTITDLDGNFSLANVAKGAKITITYVGYKPQTLTWNGTALNVTMEDDSNMLEETVVIGYGTVKKADLAGSVAVMEGKSFKDQPVARVEDALNGRMSGVQVMSSGVPGGAMKIRVRGASSVNKSNDPLYVVDGIVRETGLEGISPEDIQSIQVLKDASSTAIYGARGANGVVMVQTKTGKAGATQVTFDGSFGFSNAYHIPEVMSTKQYAQALVDHKGVSQSAVQDYLNGTKAGIDWMDELLQTGITQNYKVSLTQGNDKTQTYFSANVMDQKGVIVDTKSRRYAIKANMHNKIFDWLEMTTDINLSQTDNSGAGFAQNQSNPIWVGLNYSPTMEMMDANGKYNKDPYNNIQNNPYGILHGSENDRKRTMVTGHVDLKFNLLKGLTFTTTNGIDYNDYKWYSFTSTKVNAAGNNMGNNDATVTALQSTNNLTYSNKWGDHGLTATGVWEVTSNEVRRMGLSGTGIAHEQLGYWNVADAASKNPSNGYSKWTMLSGVARVMYNYADRYMLTGTFRADGSSRFTNKKWGYFPSVGAAWVISNEDFTADQNVLDYLKVRASWGKLGNDKIAASAGFASTNPVRGVFGNTVLDGYTYESNFSWLSWEVVNETNVGLNFATLNNRLSGDIDWYYRKTENAVISPTIPMQNTTIAGNYATILNTGVDLSLNWADKLSKDFSYNVGFNIGYLHNEVKSLLNNLNIIKGGKTVQKVGEKMNSYYGYKVIGIYQTPEECAADPIAVANKLVPGDFKYEDVNGDGAIDGRDKQCLGSYVPDVTYGFNLGFQWKALDFNISCYGQAGGELWNRKRALRYAASNYNFDRAQYENRWHGAGTSNTDPSAAALIKGWNVSDSNQASYFVESSDYFRIQNITLGYSFRNIKLGNYTLPGIRISATADRPFTTFKANSFTPELADAEGWDTQTYPLTATYTFGVQIDF